MAQMADVEDALTRRVVETIFKVHSTLPATNECGLA
jgi:hypothetical protein